uniref:Uncharacterized protein n=1 Tax=Timema poppense TaxID=170557 RepID=A0A7R9CJQ9_TIMPO|nr:unnamed protein product [Timema poppensis]
MAYQFSPTSTPYTSQGDPSIDLSSPESSTQNADIILESIAIELRSMVPLEAILPSEHIREPCESPAIIYTKSEPHDLTALEARQEKGRRGGALFWNALTYSGRDFKSRATRPTVDFTGLSLARTDLRMSIISYFLFWGGAT